MKIAIDVSQVVYGTGVSNYVKNLVVNLLEIDKKNHYLLFGGTLRENKKLTDFFRQLKGTNFQTKITPFSPHPANLLWNKFHILPIETITGPIDVYLSSDWAQAPTKKAKTLTIAYDLIPWLYPETLHPKIINTHKNRMAWVKKEVGQIIAISQSTKKDLKKIVNIAEEKITVAYPGLDKNRFFPQSKEKIAQVKKKYQLKNYILGLGTQEPRKNFNQVITAFEKLNHHDLELAIVGKYGWGEKINNKNKKIKMLGYVPDEDLALLYSGASVFVYPSLYEGFGMPIVEAQACGCPVLTSNVSSMPEAAGQGAILVNPQDNNEIVQSLEKIITNRSFRKNLIKKGKENADRFSWKESAQKILRVIKSLQP
ncbi:MAG: glycosyltransferase family 1 protein [Candidatus Shapirobacteria bacterium]|nr:glycosyltransferase family 1 protein [Candidatus Shapirobacteria bacterium]MDD5481858.1 glycosyltransferase family 1 protein [Candidatus Shapirobacteria bacterium]